MSSKSSIASFAAHYTASALRDHGNASGQLTERGIPAFRHREASSYALNVCSASGSVKISYKISFNRHAHQPKPVAILAVRAPGLHTRYPRGTTKSRRFPT